MGIVCELASNVIQICIMIWCISEFCGCKYTGVRKYICYAVMLAVDFFFISYVDRFTDYDGLLSVVSVIGYVVYGQIALKGKLSEHIFISLFVMVMIFTLSSFIVLAASNISDFSSGSLMTEFSSGRLVILCVCRALEFLVFKLILHIKREYALDRRDWVMLIVLLFFTWIEVMLFTKASIMAVGISGYMTGAAAMAVVVNALVYYFIVSISKAAAAKTELSLLKMQYDSMKVSEENMRLLYDSTHEVKHDLEKRFLYIKTLEEQGRGDDVIKYIDKTVGEELNASHRIMFTDNEIFNALMNIRLEICHDKDIRPIINVDSTAINAVKSEDIVILFGNIFDNAIEAAEKTENKLIILNICNQGDYISVYMENSFDGRFDKNMRTTKPEKYHGIGMKNVRKIIDKYDGMIKCFPDGEMFCCDILLKRKAF